LNRLKIQGNASKSSLNQKREKNNGMRFFFLSKTISKTIQIYFHFPRTPKRKEKKILFTILTDAMIKILTVFVFTLLSRTRKFHP
jgi:hypothetical protein